MNPFFAAEVVPLGKTDQGHFQRLGAFNVFFQLRCFVCCAGPQAELIYSWCDTASVQCGHPGKLVRGLVCVTSRAKDWRNL